MLSNTDAQELVFKLYKLDLDGQAEIEVYRNGNARLQWKVLGLGLFHDDIKKLMKFAKQNDLYVSITNIGEWLTVTFDQVVNDGTV